MTSNYTSLDDLPPPDVSILNATMKEVEDAILHNILSSQYSHYVSQMDNNTLTSPPTAENTSSLSPTGQENFEVWLNLVVEGYGILLIAICGMILHITGICYIITKAKRSNLFTMMLVSVIVFDSLYLFCKIVTALETHFITFPYIYPWVLKYLIYPMSRFSMSASIFMIVALARERHFAVYKPILHRQTYLSFKNRRNHLLMYLCTVVVVTISLNLTVFWETDITYDKGDLPDLKPSDMRMNPYYSLVYVMIIRFGFSAILPILLLTYLNYGIVKGSKRGNIPQLRVHIPPIIRRRSESAESRRTNSMIIIIIIFLICHIPRVALNFVEYFILTLYDNVPIWVVVFKVVSHVLLVLNACVHTICYTIS